MLFQVFAILVPYIKHTTIQKSKDQKVDIDEQKTDTKRQ